MTATTPATQLTGCIVSVQASGDEPLNKPEILTAFAKSVLDGGAAGLRLAQPENITAFYTTYPQYKNTLPVIGITKPEPLPENWLNEVYITPRFADVAALAASGVPIVALDATLRDRPEPLEALVSRIRESYPQLALMADIATLDDALNAQHLGFDYIGTTLAGYTSATAPGSAGPDFDLLKTLTSQLQTPIIMEGRIQTPEQAQQALALGAQAVVVGSAISRPHLITQQFVNACHR